ncbi:MAG: hypothetical protein ACLSUH_02960 [Ruminococcus sp.]
MRLIDADKLKKDMLLKNILGEPMQKIIDRYIHIVDEQPTAFDLDKTVKELDEKSFLRRHPKNFTTILKTENTLKMLFLLRMQ